MKPSQAKQAVHACIEARQPVFLWGPPGIGKSMIMEEIAKDLNLDFRDVRVSLLDPVDMRGLPYRDKKSNTMCWAPAVFLPTHGKGLLFLDEANSGVPAVQAATYQLILNRKLGEYELPEGWVMAAAGNRETDRSVVHRMPAALANRYVHIDVDVDMDDWCAWAASHAIKPEIIAFIRFRPNLLHNFDPERKAFPSPRSWEFVSNLMTRAEISKDIELNLIAGTVGDGAAGEFISFLRIYRDLPNPDGILLHPDKAPVPDDPATLYALTGALAARASESNFSTVMKYGKRLPPEFQVVLVTDANARDNNIENTDAFVQWAITNADVLS